MRVLQVVLLGLAALTAADSSTAEDARVFAELANTSGLGDAPLGLFLLASVSASSTSATLPLSLPTHRPDQGSTPAGPVKCDANGATMCNSKSKASYFQCARHVWTEMTCVAGTVCRVVRNNAVCVDPNTAVQVSDSDRDVQIACPTNNMTMCDGSDRSSFYTCTNNKWAKMKCDHNTVCIVRHDKALCADQATANAPVQPCTVAKSTRCVPDNRRVFQVCSDGFWANSTCAGSDFCLFRANAAMCVDKATADAPVLPCKQPNATRCVDGSAVAYQVCSDGYWTNATCNRGSVCGMKQGAALCHDPKQPIIDVPDQPCSNDGTMQCPEDNASRYQVCTDGLWANFTCDGTNVCRMSGDRAVCGDRDGADAPLSMVTLHAPTGYRANVSLGTSTHALCAWSITALLGVTALALGAGV